MQLSVKHPGASPVDPKRWQGNGLMVFNRIQETNQEMETQERKVTICQSQCCLSVFWWSISCSFG